MTGFRAWITHTVCAAVAAVVAVFVAVVVLLWRGGGYPG